MNKYGAKKTVVDGITFDSKREAGHYQELRLLEKAGQIRNLQLQVPFVLKAAAEGGEGGKYALYRADFVFEERPKSVPKNLWGVVDAGAYLTSPHSWVKVVADSKGKRTEAYMIKKRAMKAQFGVDIREL